MNSSNRYDPYPLLIRLVAHLVLVAIVVGVCYLVVRLPTRDSIEDSAFEGVVEEKRVQSAAFYSPVDRACEPIEHGLEPASLIEEIRGVVRKRETVSDILLRQGFSPEFVHELNRATKPVFDLRRIRVDQRYSLAKVGTTFCHFTYEVDPEHYLLIASHGSDLHAEVRRHPFTVHVDSVMGTITSSLFEAVLEGGERPELALGLSEIFAWDIDFFLDIRKGDQFKVFYEKKCLGDSIVCLGRVLAAEFVVQGKPHRAIYFCDGSGYDDYYNGEGGSLRKALLKAPLRYSRISSGFSYRRRHPIHRHYAPHLGIDYAAPTGTPVRATGGGTVIFAARKGANGNMVQIRHNETYVTYYLHLSRFAKGVKKGRRVRQGDVIGYVGSTGSSTGPHLDYRIKKHGTFVDPRKIDLPASEPVAAAYREEFEAVRNPWLKRLDRLGTAEGEETLARQVTGPGPAASPAR